LVEEFLAQKVDVRTGPPFEAKLWKLSDREHVLVLTIDHFVSDGVSNGILAREVWTLYGQAARGQPFCLPPLPVQFADYAVWHQQTHDAWMQKHEDYWTERLKGVPRLEVPCDAGLEEVSSSGSVTVHIPIGSILSNRLRDVAGYERTLLSLVVLTAYATAMSHWCRQRDLLIPFLLHGRHGRPELQNVIGYISHALHLRIEIDRAPTFHDLLSQVRREFSAATEHQDFDRVPDFVPECQSELNFHWRSRSRMQTAHEPSPAFSGQIRTQPFITRVTDWSHKFWSVFHDTPAGIVVTVNYNPNCLAPSTIQRFGAQLRWAADALVNRPYEKTDME
jgi:Condensation domain